MNPISIIIIEDHALVREAWAMCLNGDERFKVLAEFGNAEDAVEPICHFRPDIILLDVNLSGMNGIEAIPHLLNRSPSSKIIGVSLHTLPNYARKMMQAGARGYVTKNSCRQEMTEAILTVQEGGKFICKQVKELVTQEFVSDESNKIDSLSPRELEVIAFIKKGLSSKEIAEVMTISIKTVEVHRYNILKKLNLRNAAALVNFISKHQPEI